MTWRPRLNEQIEKNVSLNSRLGESVANGILESVSEGLASTQKEKTRFTFRKCRV